MCGQRLADAHSFPRMISTHRSSSLGTLVDSWYLEAEANPTSFEVPVTVVGLESSRFLVNFVFKAVGLVFLLI